MTARVQGARTSANNTPPGSLLPGQFFIEMGTPLRLWAGVPTSIDATGRRLLLDVDARAATDATFLKLTGGTMTGPITIAGGTNPLVVTNAAGQVPASYIGGANFVVFSTVGGNNRIVLDALNGNPMFTGRQANGTPAVLTGTTQDQVIIGLQCFGRGATSYIANARGGIAIRAAENFTDTAAGSYINFQTAPIGSVTAGIERARISDQGALLIGTTTPTGTEKLRVVGGAVLDGLTLNGNTVPPPAGVTALLRLVGADAASSLASVEAFGGNPVVQGRRAQGTAAAPLAVTTAVVLLNLNGLGYGATGYSATAQATISLRAAENWTDTAHGTNIAFLVTRSGGVVLAEAMRLSDAGALLIGTTAPVGTEKLNVVGGAVIDTIRVTPTTAPLVISDGSTPPVSGTGVLLALVSAGASRLEVTAFSGLSTSFVGRASGGTPAAQTPMASGQVLSLFGGQGWNGSIFAGSVQIQYVAAENYTATTSGSYMAFMTTLVGASARREVMRLSDAGALLIGTTVPIAAERLIVQGLDNQPAISVVDGIGAAGLPVTLGRSALGTSGARTAVALNQVLHSLQGAGYGQAGYSTARALIEMRAAEAWSGAGQGAYMTFLVTPKGTNGPIEVMRLADDATVLIGKTVSAGLVSLEVAGGAIVDALTLGSDPVAPTDAANKQYVDSKIDGSGHLPVSGGTMTGPLVLVGDPAAALQASTKQYVDATVRGRNYLHNGLFNIAQRGVGPFTLNAYTADRWQLFFNLDTDSLSVVSVSDASRAAIGDEAATWAISNIVTGNAGAAAYSFLTQPIEGVRRLAGKTVTVSFWAAAVSGTPKIGVSLDQSFGTGGAPSAAVSGAGQVVTIGTVWARYSLTFALPSVAGKTLGTAGNDITYCNFWFSSGAAQAARAGNIGVQSGNFVLWGVQLETGPVATPLEKTDPQQELAKCQRFFERILFAGINVTGYTTQATPPIVAGARIGFATVKRATPTVTGPPAGISAFNVAGVVAITGNFTPDPRGIELRDFGSATGSVAGQWNAVPVGGNAGCYIDASADL